MKQSEHKAILAKQREEFLFLPKKVIIYRCNNIRNNLGGCSACYACDKCGRSGCGNMLGGPGIEYQIVECDLEEG